MLCQTYPSRILSAADEHRLTDDLCESANHQFCSHLFEALNLAAWDFSLHSLQVGFYLWPRSRAIAMSADSDVSPYSAAYNLQPSCNIIAGFRHG
jgi:hypothetical protein